MLKPPYSPLCAFNAVADNSNLATLSSSFPSFPVRCWYKNPDPRKFLESLKKVPTTSFESVQSISSPALLAWPSYATTDDDRLPITFCNHGQRQMPPAAGCDDVQQTTMTDDDAGRRTVTHDTRRRTTTSDEDAINIRSHSAERRRRRRATPTGDDDDDGYDDDGRLRQRLATTTDLVL